MADPSEELLLRFQARREEARRAAQLEEEMAEEEAQPKTRGKMKMKKKAETKHIDEGVDAVNHKAACYYRDGAPTSEYISLDLEYGDNRTHCALHHILCNQAARVALKFAAESPSGIRIVTKEGYAKRSSITL